MDNYIFLILRENPSDDEAKQYYDRYRDDCLKSLRGDEFKTMVARATPLSFRSSATTES